MLWTARSQIRRIFTSPKVQWIYSIFIEFLLSRPSQHRLMYTKNRIYGPSHFVVSICGAVHSSPLFRFGPGFFFLVYPINVILIVLNWSRWFAILYISIQRMFGINLVAILIKIDLQHGSISQVGQVNVSPTIRGYKSTT